MEGVVRIQGRDTRDYPAGGLSGIVGLVQQDPEAQLYALTVNDEVAFGPENLRIAPEEIPNGSALPCKLWELRI